MNIYSLRAKTGDRYYKVKIGQEIAQKTKNESHAAEKVRVFHSDFICHRLCSVEIFLDWTPSVLIQLISLKQSCIVQIRLDECLLHLENIDTLRHDHQEWVQDKLTKAESEKWSYISANGIES